MTSNQVNVTGTAAPTGTTTATLSANGQSVVVTWTTSATQTSASVKRRCVTDGQTFASVSAVNVAGSTKTLSDLGDQSWGYFSYGKVYEYEVTVNY